MSAYVSPMMKKNGSIGTAASHGCMRMHMWDIEDLYERVEWDFFFDEKNLCHTGYKPESGLGPHIYRQTLSNILGPGARRNELWNASRRPNEYGVVDNDETANNFEAAVVTAGYDGYMVDGGGGKAMIVVLGADVPVDMVERPAPPVLKQGVKLTPAEQAIEARLAATIADDFDAALARYNEEPEAVGGKVLNTDVARELSEDYRADRSQSRAVHEPASQFIKDVYAKKLAEPKGPGGNVFFTAGGSSS